MMRRVWGSLLWAGLLVTMLGACTNDAPSTEGEDDTRPGDDTGSEPYYPTVTDSDVDSDIDTGPDLTGESCTHPLVLEPYVPWVAHGAHMQDEFTDDHNWNDLASCTTEEATCPSANYSPCQGYNSEVVFRAELKRGQIFKLNTESRAEVVFRFLENCAPEEAQCRLTHWGGWYQPMVEWVAPDDATYYGVIELRQPTVAIKYGEHMGWDLLINTPERLHYYLEAGVYDATETDCADGLDNNGDHLIDCLDPACFETCGVELLLDETFEVDLVALGETFEVSPPPYTIETPAVFETSFGAAQATEPVGWHVCGSTGSYRDGAPPYCIQPGFRDENLTRSSSGGGYMLMADAYGVSMNDGAYLSTGPIELDGQPNVVLTYAQASPKGNFPVYVQVQLSVDDGQTWQVVRQYDRYSKLRRERLMGFQAIDLSALVGAVPSIRVRFFYTDGGMTSGSQHSYAGNWQLDDIRVLQGAFDVLPGLAGDEMFKSPVVPEHVEGNDGCSGTDAVCQSLAGHDFGSCGEELGWFYNGRICEKAIGCAGSGYCLFEDRGECARSCSAAGQCNMDAFVGPQWPERGVELPIMAEGQFVISGTADNWDDLADMWPDEDFVYPMAFDKESCSKNLLPEVLRCTTWPALLASGMTWEDAWKFLCSYSLIDDKVFINVLLPMRGTPK